MRIPIKNSIGKTLHVDINVGEEVMGLDIKKLLFKQVGIEVADQELIVAEKKWPNNQTYSMFSAYNPSAPRSFTQNQSLLLIIKPTPEHLRLLVGMNYEALREYSAPITSEITKDTRTKRYDLKDYMETEHYWNSLDEYERTKILKKPKYASLIDSVSKETTPPFHKD